MLDLSQELSKLGHEPYGAFPFDGQYSEALKGSTKSQLDVPFRRFSFWTLLRILTFCKKYNIKTIHSHGRGAGIYSRALKAFGFKVVHTFHGVHLENTFTGRLKTAIDRVLKSATDSFICVSKSEFSTAKQERVSIPNKTYVIPNGVQVSEEKKERSPRLQSPLILGSLSRLNYQKGLDIFISTVEDLLKSDPALPEKVRFNIAGGGELQDEIAQKMKVSSAYKVVDFLGPTSVPLDFLSNIDIYFSFARWEGLPIAVLEAMSLGLPCLLSDVEGNKDLIQEGFDGLLFKLGDSNSFQEKLSKLIESPLMREELGHRARQKVQKDYSLKRMAEETLKIYRNLEFN